MKGSFRLGSKDSDPMVDIVAEPLETSSDPEVLDKLESLGAINIRQLADGYLTARVRRSRIEQIEVVAVVTVKSVNRLFNEH